MRRMNLFSPCLVVGMALYPGKEPTDNWVLLYGQKALKMPAECHSWCRDTLQNLEIHCCKTKTHTHTETINTLQYKEIKIVTQTLNSGIWVYFFSLKLPKLEFILNVSK